MRIKDLSLYQYVCPYCFSTLKECNCDSYPSNLIQIDKNMLPIIKVLNSKYFITTDCCEGHIGHGEKMYIFFKTNYKFKKPLPIGVTYNKGVLSADIKGTSDHSKKLYKSKLLKNLYQWALELEK